MLTIFSIPKPFTGHVGLIQRNAIGSWRELRPACEIILCGDEPGVEEAVSDAGLRWIPMLAKNEFGTPLVSSAFEQVRRVASNNILCYANADIILMQEIISAVERLKMRRFLMVGRRWKVAIEKPLNFEEKGWQSHLRKYVRSHGQLAPPDGIDYFVFPKDWIVGELPPFVVGRPCWDNWFIYRARRERIPVIDATRAVMVVHQNHDYSHIPHGSSDTWVGPEAEENRALLGGEQYLFTIDDSTHILSWKSLRPALHGPYLKKRLMRLSILRPNVWRFLGPMAGIAIRLRSVLQNLLAR